MSPVELATIRRRAVEDNERDTRLGLMPRHCDDPALLARVAGLLAATLAREGGERVAS